MILQPGTKVRVVKPGKHRLPLGIVAKVIGTQPESVCLVVDKNLVWIEPGCLALDNCMER